MTTMAMTPEQENTSYADPANQAPQGPPVRRKTKLSEPMPVRFPQDLLNEVSSRAAADDRSVFELDSTGRRARTPAKLRLTQGRTRSLARRWHST